MLLSNPSARFVRVYLGNKDGKLKLILVAVDARGNYIPKSMLLESPIRCPEVCSSSGSMNIY